MTKKNHKSTKQKKTTIKRKILSKIIPVTVVFMVLLFLTNYIGTKMLIDNEISTKMDYKITGVVDSIERQLGDNFKIALAMSNIASINQNKMSKADYEKHLEKFIKGNAVTLGSGVWFEPNAFRKNEIYNGFYVYKDGDTIQSTDEYSNAEYDYPNTDWYKIGINAGEGEVASTDVYYDETLAIAMMSSSAAIRDADGNELGVTTADIDLSGIQNMIDSIKVGKKSNCILLNKENLYLAHSADSSKEFKIKATEDNNKSLAKAVSTFINSGNTKGNGVFKGTTFKGDNLIYFAKVPSTGWTLGITIAKSELYAPLYSTLIVLSIIMLFILVGLCFLINIFTNRITNGIKQAVTYGDILATGKLNENIDSKYNDEIDDLIDSYKRIAQSMQKKADALDNISKGDLDIKVDVLSEDDILSMSINKMSETLNDLISEVTLILDGASKGILDTRGNSDKFVGGYSDLIKGFNNVLETIILPIKDSIAEIEKLSNNDFTTAIEGDYQGDLKELTDGINKLRTRLLSVQDVIISFANGDTHNLEEFKKTGKHSENDKMIPAIIVAYSTLKSLIDDITKLTDGAIRGDLTVRGDASKYEGEYRNILQGINNTLDAVVTPINETSEALEKISKGDLTVTIDSDYEGLYNNMKESINHLSYNLRNIMMEIIAASQQVTSGSMQVSNASQNLAQGSAEQAGSIEELSATITDLGYRANENARVATSISDLYVNITSQTYGSKEQMDNLLVAMKAINESSNSISQIIKIIDDIAFQTNMLAINANVEAARAGREGKGFAVVAEEVKKLAAKSADAAKETEELIKTSLSNVEKGVNISAETSESLDKISTEITRTVEQLKGIAESSTEQSVSIAQINSGVEQIAAVVQSNSATSEETAASSEELLGQAEMLKEKVTKFII